MADWWAACSAELRAVAMDCRWAVQMATGMVESLVVRSVASLDVRLAAWRVVCSADHLATLLVFCWVVLLAVLLVDVMAVLMAGHSAGRWAAHSVSQWASWWDWLLDQRWADV